MPDNPQRLVVGESRMIYTLALVEETLSVSRAASNSDFFISEIHACGKINGARLTFDNAQVTGA